MTPYYLLAIVIQLIWGFTPSASKIVLTYLPVEAYSAIRYSFSGLLFLAVTRIRYRHFSTTLPLLPKLVGLGVLAYALDSLCTLYGLKIGGVLSFALASSLNALITSLLSIFFLKEAVRKGFYLALAISLGGGLLLFFGKAEVSSSSVAGLSLILIWLAYFFEALGFVFSKKFRQQIPLGEYLGVLQLSAGVFMWCLCLATGKFPSGILEMPARGWMALGFVCIFSCTLCYFALYWLLNFLEGHRLAFFDAFHTVSAAIFGVLLFGDLFNAKMIAGGFLLLFAVYLVLRSTRRSEIKFGAGLPVVDPCGRFD